MFDATVSDINESSVDERQSRRSLNLLGKTNEPHGRERVKEARAQETREFRMESCLTSIADRIIASCDDRKDEDEKDVFAEGLQAMANVAKDSVSIRRMEQASRLPVRSKSFDSGFGCARSTRWV